MVHPHPGGLTLEVAVSLMSCLENPRDNAESGGFMKTFKGEDAYIGDYENFAKVASGLLNFVESTSNVTGLRSVTRAPISLR